jgi:hypothetical protein
MYRHHGDSKKTGRPAGKAGFSRMQQAAIQDCMFALAKV